MQILNETQGNVSVSAEPLGCGCVHLIRMHGNGEGYGSPYKFCCVVVRDGVFALLKGGVGKPSIAGIKLIGRLMKKLGFEKYRYERLLPNGDREVEKLIPYPK